MQYVLRDIIFYLQRVAPRLSGVCGGRGGGLDFHPSSEGGGGGEGSAKFCQNVRGSSFFFFFLITVLPGIATECHKFAFVSFFFPSLTRTF